MPYEDNVLSLRKSPSILNSRRSTASLRPTLTPVDDDAPNGRHSLAHELAVALMPEPNAASKLLADEFAIEYDEGAEGIDDPFHHDRSFHFVSDDHDSPSFADELASATPFDSDASPPELDDIPSEPDDPPPSPPRLMLIPPQQDALEVLAQDLKSTDIFLAHLRTLESNSSGAQPLALERLASDVIRRIDDTVRNREGQVRELLGYEREFRRIAGELGGNDVLSVLDELEHIEGLSDVNPPPTNRPESSRPLDTVEEEPLSPRQPFGATHDWETDPDHLHDDENNNEEIESVASPIKDVLPPPPPVDGHPTPAKTIPHLAHLRSFTVSLVTSLTTLSEQAQVNAAATTEAGRKIRALKNKLGEWRTDWDSAERSRVRIDRWEAGILDGGDDHETNTLSTVFHSSRRVDGRTVVQEHLRAFEIALADAVVKTEAIMAS